MYSVLQYTVYDDQMSFGLGMIAGYQVTSIKI